MTGQERLMSYPAMIKFKTHRADYEDIVKMITEKDLQYEEPFRSLCAVASLAQLALTGRVIADDKNTYEADPEIRQCFEKGTTIVFEATANKFTDPNVEKPEFYGPNCFTPIIKGSLNDLLSKEAQSEDFAETAYYVACFTALGSIYEFLTMNSTDERIVSGFVKVIGDFNILAVKFFEDYLKQEEEN